MSELPKPVDTLRALIGDMAYGLAVGGNDDESLRDYYERLIKLAIELDDYLTDAKLLPETLARRVSRSGFSGHIKVGTEQLCTPDWANGGLDV